MVRNARPDARVRVLNFAKLSKALLHANASLAGVISAASERIFHWQALSWIMLEHIGHQFISRACRTSAFQRGRAPKFHHRRLKLLSTFWLLAHGSRAERLPSAMCLHRLLEMALGSQRVLQISGQISLSYTFLLRQQSSIVRMRKNDWTLPTASLYVTSRLIATYCAARIQK
jgi:hypothetical protein